MKKLMVLLLLSCITLPAWADSIGYTVRNTEIKAKPFSDAATLATLPEKASVTIVQRMGGWVRISSSTGNGWVKMLNLRSSSARTGDSGLQSLFNVGRTGSSGITVATGVRGLSSEDVQNASPNPVEFAKLKNYAVNQNQASQFAQSGKLKSYAVEFVAAQ
ncbi:MAG: hypothetical protein PXX73_02445 [Sideroxydans sp.]|nr:hypothetical protein [Sideroxydans sp.]